MGDYNKSIIAANNIEEATKIYGDAIAYLGDPDLNISDKDRRPYIDYIDKVYTEKYNSLKAKKKEVKSNDKENIPGVSSNQRERESTKQTESNKTTSREETSTSGVLQTQNEEVKQTNLLPEGEKQTEENQKKTDIEIKKKDQESKIEEVKQNKLLDTEMYSEKNASGMQGNIFRDIEEEKPKSKTPNADKLKEKVKGEIFYKILGLPKNATLEQIKKAFREKSLELHPDQNKADNAEQSFKDLYKEYDQALKVIQENSINAQRKAKAEAEREKANKAWEAYEKGVEKRRAETKTSDNPVIDGWKIGLKSFYQKNKDGKWIKIGGNSYGYVYHKPTIEKLEKALNEINNKKTQNSPLRIYTKNMIRH